jgi:tyrosine-protein phosphatase SIW14
VLVFGAIPAADFVGEMTSRWARAAGIVVLAAAATVGLLEAQQALAAADEKLALPGVANFGRLNAHLYRGAQPQIAAYSSLKTLGIDTVVRFSTGEEFIAGEREHVEALHMRFISLPWRTAETPTVEQVATFLGLVRDHPDWTFFVHCREGVDRTGVMVALYRIALDHWTVDRALAEMKAFHYHFVFHPHLQRYVEAFPAQLSSDPELHAIETAVPQ